MGIKKYDQIMRRIEDLISLNTIKDGERVPSVRSMAKQMGVSVMTVLEGYRRLESLGLIESRPQSGYYVRPGALHASPPLARPPRVSRSDIALRTESVLIPESVERLLTQALRKDVLPLGSGMPAADYYPSEELSICLARVARSDPELVNRYCIGGGQGVLVERIARWMMEAGCVTPEEEIVVTAGATQALMLAIRAVTRPGDTVAVESPGYYGFYSLLQFFNLKAVEIPCDPQSGLAVDALQTILRQGLRPACVILSPAYSNPTAAVMPDTNKEELVKLCLDYNLPIIEDDTFGELSYDTYRPRPLKALAPDTVLHVGSFSKVLAPGYRVAWLAGGRHTRDILRCHAMSVLATPVVTQLALASYLKGGGLKRHLRLLRKKYQVNAGLLQAKIALCFPAGTRTCNPRGGHFLWVELPPGHDAVKLSVAAAEEGISIAPGVLFSSRQHYRRNFRLNFAVKWSEEVEKAIERLGELSAVR
ncbi:transcriptional regulator [Desulfocucumis palustris]|uniref:Transcriptional regulator n=1 Tax=Desulfocucumis palustris TaxID=1898651 RepID=A0A2L2XJG8_9FIRM|nr:PLP-dependent aminotransferase family protein [Desulfocucumis palustris]GBF34406.1 transcriptional regulator [Desulfocucumis palustris]